MNISDILSVDNIVIIDDATSKRQLLKDLSEKAAQTTGLTDRVLFDIVLERENLGSTAFGGGTAIPHGRIPQLDKVCGVFARLAKGVDFDAADKKTVDLVFMLLSPENSGADHLVALSKVSALIKNEDCCDKLRQAKTAKEIYKVLVA